MVIYMGQNNSSDNPFQNGRFSSQQPFGPVTAGSNPAGMQPGTGPVGDNYGAGYPGTNRGPGYSGVVPGYPPVSPGYPQDAPGYPPASPAYGGQGAAYPPGTQGYGNYGGSGYGNYGGRSYGRYGSGYAGGPPNGASDNEYPYAEYNGGNRYNPYMRPPKNNSRALIGVVIGVMVLLALILLVLLYGVTRGLAAANVRTGMKFREDYGYGEGYQGRSSDGNDSGYGDENSDYDYAGDDSYGNDDGYDPYDSNGDGYADYDYDRDYYPGVEDAIRKDLEYSIEWKQYSETNGTQNGEEQPNGDTYMEIVYPVIKGGQIPNREQLNQAISKEIEYIKEIRDEYSQYLSEGDVFYVYAEGYVTYMDEKTVSVVFEESFNDSYATEVAISSINLNLEEGIVVDNNSIVNTDDDFAVDFRKRSDTQNGSIADMDMMTDQQIAKYLSDEDAAVVFYTPLGLEIGFNYENGWVTVTYKEYDKYLKKM